MKQIRMERAIVKAYGEERITYYLPEGNSFEIIKTHVPIGHKQLCHVHNEITEAFLVLEGTLTAKVFNEDGKVSIDSFFPGDFFIFEPGEKHTIENNTDIQCVCLTFKFLDKPKDVELFRADKVTYGDAI